MGRADDLIRKQSERLKAVGYVKLKFGKNFGLEL